MCQQCQEKTAGFLQEIWRKIAGKFQETFRTTGGSGSLSPCNQVCSPQISCRCNSDESVSVSKGTLYYTIDRTTWRNPTQSHPSNPLAYGRIVAPNCSKLMRTNAFKNRGRLSLLKFMFIFGEKKRNSLRTHPFPKKNIHCGDDSLP